MRIRSLLTLVLCLALALPVSAVCTFDFLPEVAYPAGTNAFQVASGDFNNDGVDDLAVVNNSSANIAILRGIASGGFGSPTYTSTGGASNTGDVVAAHMNNDAYLDLVVLGGVTGAYTGTHVQVLVGNGTGFFTLGDSESIDSHPDDLISGDFDNDNDIDIAVSKNSSNPAQFNLLLNNGAGVLTQKSENFIVLDPGPGSWIYSLAAGDFDGDGKLDVATPDQVNKKVWIFFGAGDGTFTRSSTPLITTTEPLHGPGVITAGDFDGDGFDDIAVANIQTGSYEPGMPTPTFVVALSNGAGRTFTSPVSYGEMGGAFDATVRDMDGDSDQDVIVADSSYVHVFINGGAGTFDEEEFDYGGLGVAILDVDKDGGPDIATAHTSTVGILQNVCGQVTLDVTSSANPASHGNSFTITASVSSTPAATGTLTLSRTGAGMLGSTNLSSSSSVSATQTLPIGTYEYVATYSGDTRFSASTKKFIQTVQTAPFGPPPGLVATSTGGTVTLSWYATSGTSRYEIFRNSGLGFEPIGETPNVVFNDPAPASGALIYKVRAISTGNIASDFSNTDFTITHAFTDENILASTTTIKNAHLAEVRTAANALRQLAGLPAASWTSSSVVLAAQFTELRTAINQARTALSGSTWTFTDALGLGVSIKAVHMLELRASMR